MANHTANGTTSPDGPPGYSGFEAAAHWLDDPTNVFIARLVGTLLVVALWWATRILSDRALTRAARKVAKRRSADDYQIKVIMGRTRPARLLIGLTAGVLGIIAILGVWGLSTAFTGLLAGAGFAGIVIGLAAADTIGDIIAGFLIFYSHPFDIGDWVEIDGVQGIVEDVALSATTIVTFDNEKITIPNRIVEGQKVKNFSHARKLRAHLLVGVAYGTDIRDAIQALENCARAHPDVMDDPEPMAISTGFGASSVDLDLRFWVEPIRNSVIKVRTDLVQAVQEAFAEAGIEIPYPHQVEIHRDAKGRPLEVYTA